MKMIKNMGITLLLGACLSLGTLTGPAMAKSLPQPPKAETQTGPINWHMLNLTPDQIKKINLLRLDFNQKALKLTAEIKIKQLEIEKQLMAPAANPMRIRQLLQEKLEQESKLQGASLENFLAIKKLLTPQQLLLLPKARNIK